ncbi:MAG TPA: NADH-quinone oxidoreductase subunit J [Nitriliruptorales bacterium]|nr:NADH-quinone oxidoreductase subunit J [Nitriliruptorales bacterium]
MLLLAQGPDASTAEVIGFWVFSVIALGGGIAMITFRNVVHGALMLVANFFAIAGLFLLLDSAFLGIIQIIIYAGAIMVLFLFVIMLLGVVRDDLLIERDRWLRAGAWTLGLLLVASVAVVFVGPYTADPSVCGSAGEVVPGSAEVRCAGLAEALRDTEQGSVGFAAERLFTRYTFAFEFVSLLLVVAIVGALLVGRRREPPMRPGGIPAAELSGGPLTDGVARGDGEATGPATPPHTHREGSTAAPRARGDGGG